MNPRNKARRRHRLAVLAVVSAAACTSAPPPAPAPSPVPVPTPSPPIVAAQPPAADGSVPGGAGLLRYHIAGRGPDTVIVPLGSWLAGSMAPLADRFVLVFYDPRHRGESHALADSSAATFDGDVADLEAVRSALGISRAAVIGFDYYAAVAAAWAAAHPARATRLVLLSPMEPADSIALAYRPREREARLDTAAARALVRARAAGRDTADPAGYCQAFWQVNARIFVGDTAAATRVQPDWCRWPNESPASLAAATGLALGSLGAAVDAGRRAAGVTAPTLVIQGRLDLVANPEGAREWALRIPGAHIFWLANVGHLPHLEAGPAVMEGIADFLAGRWPPRATPPGGDAVR